MVYWPGPRSPRAQPPPLSRGPRYARFTKPRISCHISSGIHASPCAGKGASLPLSAAAWFASACICSLNPTNRTCGGGQHQDGIRSHCCSILINVGGSHGILVRAHIPKGAKGTRSIYLTHTHHSHDPRQRVLTVLTHWRRVGDIQGCVRMLQCCRCITKRPEENHLVAAHRKSQISYLAEVVSFLFHIFTYHTDPSMLREYSGMT